MHVSLSKSTVTTQQQRRQQQQLNKSKQTRLVGALISRRQIVSTACLIVKTELKEWR